MTETELHRTAYQHLKAVFPELIYLTHIPQHNRDWDTPKVWTE